MRIFGLVFGLLFLLLVVGAVLNRSQDFIVVAIESWKLRNQISGLTAALKSANSSDCFDEVTNEGRALGVQLRFDTESSYVIEQVCEASHLEKPLIRKHTLSNQVKRVYGSGIMILRDDEKIEREGWVILGKNETQMSVGLDKGEAKIEIKSDQLTYGGNNAANASCTEWGFFCCDNKTSIGEGETINATDCANNCFQSCNTYPTVLFFNTEPFLNQKTRTLYLEGKETQVEFAYQFVDDQEIKKAVIDFGDGKNSEHTASKAKDILHTYSCNQSRCVFEATLTAWDIKNAINLPSDLSKVKIIVQP